VEHLDAISMQSATKSSLFAITGFVRKLLDSFAKVMLMDVYTRKKDLADTSAGVGKK